MKSCRMYTRSLTSPISMLATIFRKYFSHIMQLLAQFIGTTALTLFLAFVLCSMSVRFEPNIQTMWTNDGIGCVTSWWFGGWHKRSMIQLIARFQTPPRMYVEPMTSSMAAVFGLRQSHCYLSGPLITIWLTKAVAAWLRQICVTADQYVRVAHIENAATLVTLQMACCLAQMLVIVEVSRCMWMQWHCAISVGQQIAQFNQWKRHVHNGMVDLEIAPTVFYLENNKSGEHAFDDKLQ